MNKLIILAALFSMSCTRIYFVYVERPVEIPEGSWRLPYQSTDPGFHLTPGYLYRGGDTIKLYNQKFNLLEIKRNEND
jgi:hypothetical protein